MVALVGGLYILFMAVGLFEEDGSLSIGERASDLANQTAKVSFMPGVTVHVKHDFNSYGDQLQQGEKGVVARVDTDGWPLIKFESLDQDLWVPPSHLDNLEIVAEVASSMDPFGLPDVGHTVAEDLQSGLMLTISGLVVVYVQSRSDSPLRQATSKRLDAIAGLL